MIDNLNNKLALVTGASSGMGAATARKLAAAGVTVGIAARRIDRLQALAAEIEGNGGKAFVLELDVSNKASVEAGVKSLQEACGPIDILINNAGLMPLSGIDEFKTDEWDQMVDVNLKGVLNLTAAVLPAMIKRRTGHVLNVSSVAGRKVFGPGFVVYSATKFAVTALTEGLRMEVGTKHNIRFTNIQPGATATELGTTTTSQDYKDMMAGFSASIVQLQPEDIADAVLYAVSAPSHATAAEIFLMPVAQA